MIKKEVAAQLAHLCDCQEAPEAVLDLYERIKHRHDVAFPACDLTPGELTIIAYLGMSNSNGHSTQENPRASAVPTEHVPKVPVPTAPPAEPIKEPEPEKEDEEQEESDSPNRQASETNWKLVQEGAYVWYPKDNGQGRKRGRFSGVLPDGSVRVMVKSRPGNNDVRTYLPEDIDLIPVQ